MLKLTFAVPYPELKPQVQQVTEQYQHTTGREIELFLTEVDWGTFRIVELPAINDVIIARRIRGR